MGTPARFVPADPYPWPWNGDLRPENTALIVIDMQTDFCGKGGYIDLLGYDISITRACIDTTRNVLAAVRRAGAPAPRARPAPPRARGVPQRRLARDPHPRRSPPGSLGSAGQQALAFAQAAK